MSRQRPELHFTVNAGWMNDPHGINFDGEKYHLYFQYVPGVTKWESKIQWGHAVSDDLVEWKEVAPALIPLDDEVGCWSGSVIADGDERVMFYTRPGAEDWGRGQVISARSDSQQESWVRTSHIPLVDGPHDSTHIDFRDPQVRRDGDVWKMTIGGGIRDVGGAAFQYSSSDLVTWNFDGVIAQGDKTSVSPIYTGTVWECPQLLHVDQHWVLLVSAMDNNGHAQELYAIGTYDGVQFAPQHWGFFGHTPTMYATTTFTDKDGRACAMSWLREANNETPTDSPYAGAQGVVVVMEVVENRLVLTPHPDLDNYLSDRIDVLSPLTVDNVAGAWRLAVDLVAESAFQMIVAGDVSWTMSIDRANDWLVVTSGEAVLLQMPLRAEPGVLDVIVDADLLEVFWSAGEGSAAVHVPASAEATVTVIGSDFAGRLAR